MATVQESQASCALAAAELVQTCGAAAGPQTATPAAAAHALTVPQEVVVVGCVLLLLLLHAELHRALQHRNDVLQVLLRGRHKRDRGRGRRGGVSAAAAQSAAAVTCSAASAARACKDSKAAALPRHRPAHPWPPPCVPSSPWCCTSHNTPPRPPTHLVTVPNCQRNVPKG